MNLYYRMLPNPELLGLLGYPTTRTYTLHVIPEHEFLAYMGSQPVIKMPPVHLKPLVESNPFELESQYVNSLHTLERTVKGLEDEIAALAKQKPKDIYSPKKLKAAPPTDKPKEKQLVEDSKEKQLVEEPECGRVAKIENSDKVSTLPLKFFVSTEITPAELFVIWTYLWQHGEMHVKGTRYDTRAEKLTNGVLITFKKADSVVISEAIFADDTQVTASSDCSEDENSASLRLLTLLRHQFCFGPVSQFLDKLKAEENTLIHNDYCYWYDSDTGALSVCDMDGVIIAEYQYYADIDAFVHTAEAVIDLETLINIILEDL